MDEATDPQPTTRISADGQWWWNGRRWVAATSADGLWQWDGTHWQFALEGSREDPAILVTELDRLATARFAEAGAVLTRRRGEWRIPPELTDRVDEAAAKLARLDELQALLDQREAQPETGLAGILGRLAGSESPAAVEREERSTVVDLEPLLAEIARAAPRPSLKEADELAHEGRALAEAATEIASANAAVATAEQNEAERLAVAEEELAAAEDTRATALRPAQAAVEEAVAARDRRLSGDRAELFRLRAPGPGGVLAEFEGFTCYQLVVEAPGGSRGPLAGARAEALTARELASQWPQIIDDLLLTEATGSELFQEAEAAEAQKEEQAVFLLVTTSLGSWLRTCPGRQAAGAREFAGRLNQAAAAAAVMAGERQQAIAAARGRLEEAAADRSEVLAAEQRLAQLAADPELEAPALAARRRLEVERASSADAEQARALLEARLAVLTAPPAPLVTEV